jgi:hypothetical protein
MGKSSDAIAEFIEEIPDDKLVGLSDPNPTHTVYQTPDFRLDVQNVSQPFESDLRLSNALK